MARNTLKPADCLRTGLAEIELMFNQLNDPALVEAARLSHPTFLVPTIGTLDGRRAVLPKQASQFASDLLHNETQLSTYPVSLTEGRYFSEVIAADFPENTEYEKWVTDTLGLIQRGQDARGAVDFESIDMLGQSIQRLDAEFASKKINSEPDALHSYYGPNKQHPYRKLTLCRTSIPVAFGDQIVPFLFEKYLVVYSYLDGPFRRKPTITPIHGHPYNHEVAYFLRHGKHSLVVEQEYEVCDADGVPLMLADGTLNRRLLDAKGNLVPSRLRAEVRSETVIRGTDTPIILEPFSSELAMRSPEVIFQADGLFRPHQVSVFQDEAAGEETLYYAVNNYWGPYGRVWVFNDDGGIVEWSHQRWSKPFSANERQVSFGG